jgi:hypothetical protein
VIEVTEEWMVGGSRSMLRWENTCDGLMFVRASLG